MSRVLKANGHNPAVFTFQSAGVWPEFAERGTHGNGQTTLAATGTTAVARAMAALRRHLEARLGPVRQQAYAQGHADGVAETRAAVQEELAEVWSALRSGLAELAAAERAAAAAREAAVLQVALQVSRQILDQELDVNPEALMPMVRKALNQTDQAVVRVLVSARDVAVLEAMAQFEDGLAGVEVVEDPALRVGDVILVTENGRYDLRVSTQLQRMAEQLGTEVHTP